MDVSEKLENEIERIEVKKVEPVSDEVICEIIETIKYIDQDMKPLLDTILRLLEEVTDQSLKTHILKRLLKFYGFENDDILTTRQKYIIVEGKLAKCPFLKEKQKECINIILKEFNVG